MRVKEWEVTNQSKAVPKAYHDRLAGYLTPKDLVYELRRSILPVKLRL